MASAWSASLYNGGLGAETPAGSRGLVGVRGRSPMKLKAFRLFHTKRAKSLVFKLKKPLCLVHGGGRPVRPGSTSDLNG